MLRRAEADRAKLADVLSGYGYYQGLVAIRLDGAPVSGQAASAVAAAEAWRNRGLVPVRIAIDLGPLYGLRRVTVRDGIGRPFPDTVLPERLTRVDADVAGPLGHDSRPRGADRRSVPRAGASVRQGRRPRSGGG